MDEQAMEGQVKRGPGAPLGNQFAKGNRGGRPAKGNKNALRHGLFANQNGLSGADDIDRACNKFRQTLEAKVVAVHGEVNEHHASLILTAIEATKAAMAFARTAKKFINEPELWLNLRKASVSMHDKRDAKIAALEIGGPLNAKDPWAEVDNPKPRLSAPASPQTHPAPESISEPPGAVVVDSGASYDVGGNSDE